MHIVDGNLRDEKRSFHNPVPMLLRDNEKYLIAYTFSDAQNVIPSVYFYDISTQRDIAKASGASIFINQIAD